MRIALLLFFALPVLSISADAAVPCKKDTPRNKPCTPGIKTKADLLERGDSVVFLHEEWRTARNKERTLREQVKIDRRTRETAKQPVTDDAFLDLMKRWDDARRSLRVKRIALQVEGDLLVKETARAYHIDKVPGKGIRGGMSQGKPVVKEMRFQPRFEPFLSTSAGAAGKTVYMAESADELSGDEGVTFPNGQIVITMEAIERMVHKKLRNPGELATVILHETIHRVSLTDGTWYEGDAAEIGPFESEKDLVSVFELENSPSKDFAIKRLKEAMQSLFQEDQSRWIDQIVERKGLASELLKDFGLGERYSDADYRKLYFKESAKLAEVEKEQRELIRVYKQSRAARKAKDKAEREAKEAEAKRLEEERRQKIIRDTQEMYRAIYELISIGEGLCRDDVEDTVFLKLWLRMKEIWDILPADIPYPRNADSRCARNLLKKIKDHKKRVAELDRLGVGFDSAPDFIALTKMLRDVQYFIREDERKKREKAERWQRDLKTMLGLFENLCRNPEYTNGYSDAYQTLRKYAEHNPNLEEWLYVEPSNPYRQCMESLISQVVVNEGWKYGEETVRAYGRNFSPNRRKNSGGVEGTPYIPVPGKPGCFYNVDGIEICPIERD